MSEDHENTERSLGTLKLPEKDIQAFKAALDYYGHERVAAYLRVAAYSSLIKHHQAGDKLAAPLGFELAPKAPEPKRIPFITRGAMFGLPLAALPGILACIWEINEQLHPPFAERPVSTRVHIPTHGPLWASK